MSEDPGRDVALFTEALRLPAEKRAVFLKRACGGDEELLRKVEALLAAHEHVGDFMETPPLAGEPLVDDSSENPGNNNGNSTSNI
jgi:hypothetical protein